mmetsp:Transcript_32715/g.82513  ORF Transcript_32715/g.82513 Transcript_32715/m.82513 type:complete len:202 (-) Transcript_32715:1064-1669(-)
MSNLAILKYPLCLSKGFHDPRQPRWLTSRLPGPHRGSTEGEGGRRVAHHHPCEVVKATGGGKDAARRGGGRPQTVLGMAAAGRKHVGAGGVTDPAAGERPLGVVLEERGAEARSCSHEGRGWGRRAGGGGCGSGCCRGQGGHGDGRLVPGERCVDRGPENRVHRAARQASAALPRLPRRPRDARVEEPAQQRVDPHTRQGG